MGMGSDYKLVDRRARPDPESEEGALKEGVYRTIGAAVKDGGGTIVLLPDVYEETLLLEGGEKLMSLAAARAALEGDAGEDLPAGEGTATILGVSFHTITLLGEASLVGVTVQQRGPGNWFAVVCAGGSPSLEGCDIDGATSSCVGLTAEGAEPTFVDCKMHGSFTGAVCDARRCACAHALCERLLSLCHLCPAFPVSVKALLHAASTCCRVFARSLAPRARLKNARSTTTNSPASKCPGKTPS